MLTINEIFLSIQGESLATGLPCIFVRLTGCNLRCSYCDTTYSFNEGSDMSIKDIISVIKSYSPVKLVELTGGEPLLQKEIVQLVEDLIAEDYRILIETNGTIPVKDIPDVCTLVMDVKTPSAKVSSPFLVENLKYFNKDTDQLKFVISDSNDYNWSKLFIKENGLESYNLLFSPNIDKLKPSTLAEWIIKDRLQVRFQLQIHKFVWNPEQRGV